MPAAIVESGPAAGVVAAALVGHGSSAPTNILSFDMGGTTAKASVIADGEVAVTADYEVGGGANAKRWIAGTGHPIRVPVVDLAEVSAGGGSIAWVDPGGVAEGRAAQRRRRCPARPPMGAAAPGRPSPTRTSCSAISTALLDGAPADRPRGRGARDRRSMSPGRSGSPCSEAAARIVEVVNANMARRAAHRLRAARPRSRANSP